MKKHDIKRYVNSQGYPENIASHLKTSDFRFQLIVLQTASVSPKIFFAALRNDALFEVPARVRFLVAFQ